MRAALLMLGSTLAFGMMAVAIRYATRYVPTQEVAFFRNAFGLLALLPIAADGQRHLLTILQSGVGNHSDKGEAALKVGRSRFRNH